MSSSKLVLLVDPSLTITIGIYFFLWQGMTLILGTMTEFLILFLLLNSIG